MDWEYWVRILIEVTVVLVGGLVAYVAAWQLRQDQSIKRLREDLVKLNECVRDHERIMTRNIPDAWESADKARDMTIQSLTNLCLHVLGRAPQIPQHPKKKKHPPGT